MPIFGDDRWSEWLRMMSNEYFGCYYDRHIRWIQEMKKRCHPTFNMIVSDYVDWDEFQEWFPDMETFEDEEEWVKGVSTSVCLYCCCTNRQ